MIKNRKNLPAFTLVEMLIAITVFTIFIGFSISSYLAFHRADQEALLYRTLLMEAQGQMNTLSEAIKSNRLLYDDDWDKSRSFVDSGIFGTSNIVSISPNILDLDNGATHTDTLALLSPDGGTVYTYSFDETEEKLFMQAFDAGNMQTVTTGLEPLPGYLEPIALNSDNVKISSLSFRIFPSVDPYASENRDNTDAAFQPIITIEMTLTIPSRNGGDLSIDLRNSITSRFYR